MAQYLMFGVILVLAGYCIYQRRAHLRAVDEYQARIHLQDQDIVKLRGMVRKWEWDKAERRAVWFAETTATTQLALGRRLYESLMYQVWTADCSEMQVTKCESNVDARFVIIVWFDTHPLLTVEVKLLGYGPEKISYEYSPMLDEEIYVGGCDGREASITRFLEDLEDCLLSDPYTVKPCD